MTYVFEWEPDLGVYPDDVETIEDMALVELAAINEDDSLFIETADLVDVKVEVLP